jgi:hypothetical protein
MKVKFKKKYMQEFKGQVIALVEPGKPAAEVPEEIEISRDNLLWARPNAPALKLFAFGYLNVRYDQIAFQILAD